MTGVPAERIQVIPSGVDLAALHAPDAAGPPTHRLADLLGIPRDRPIIGCVANLQPPKSLDTLVAAAARVRATHPEVVFCVLGEGPERPRLERQVQARGLTAGFFLPGFQTDAAALVPEMTAVVLPSRAEGLGTSLLEAMAVSRPVVASRVGGIPEVVTDGTDGLLVPPGDEEALAATLRRLLEDAALRDRLGAAAARRAEAFSADRMVAAVQAVYEDVFGASPSASGEEDSGT